MIIPINHSYRLASDERQWMVQRLRKYKGAQRFEPVSFHATLESAIDSLRQRMVRTSKAETLADALADMKSVSTTLSRALTEPYGGNVA